MRVLFIGFAVSDAMFDTVMATDRGMPAQTQRFGWSVIEALHEAGVECVLVSAEPVADFPGNSRLVVRGRSFARNGVRGRSVSFVNVTGLKHLTRYLGALYRTHALRRQNVDAVLVHGVHSPFLWAALRLGARRRIPVITLMTDPPSIRTPYDNRATLVMKRLDRQMIGRALARMSGVVVLAPALVDDFAPGVPSLLMEGIASESASETRNEPFPPCPPTVQRQDRPTVVYAGGLREEYGVVDLAEAAIASNMDWQVVFYGRGPSVEAIQRIAADSDRVKYGGTVSTGELPQIYQAADLLANPRRLENFTNYSFPSKMLEYMVSGTPVLTTRLPTLPADYQPYLIMSEPGPRGLASTIDEAMSCPPGQLSSLGSRAREFALSTRGQRAQGERLRDFIVELTGVSASRKHH